MNYQWYVVDFQTAAELKQGDFFKTGYVNEIMVGRTKATIKVRNYTTARGSLGWTGLGLLGCSAFIAAMAIIGFLDVFFGIVKLVYR